MKPALDPQLRLLERSSETGRGSTTSATRSHEQADTSKEPQAPAITVGRIASIDVQGRVMVILDGRRPVVARLSSSVRRAEILAAAASGTPVLLLLEDGAVASPIIVGMVRDRLEGLEPTGQGDFEVQVGRDRLTLTAHQELTLRCGEGCITLRRDGKVIIKGEEIVSRARGTNKVKGATVKIN